MWTQKVQTLFSLGFTNVCLCINLMSALNALTTGNANNYLLPSRYLDTIKSACAYIHIGI